VWLIPIVDERVGVQEKNVKSLENTTPERFRDGVSLRRGDISSACTYLTFTFTGIASPHKLGCHKSTLLLADAH